MAEAGETPPCLSCDKPSEWTSPTGHHFCQTHREIFSDLFPPDGLQPVDLRALMSGERPEEDWLIEPVLPAGKLVGIVSKRGEGKSLLMLDMVAAKASGQKTLSQPAGDPIHVVYVDMEMGPDDLYERLADLGYLADHPQFETLADHLHYYQLVALPPLDTEEGGQALEELVDKHGATLVVIDTVSRVISGAENDAEPFRDLFRHTETRLKRRRVTLARLDHLGKDKERGSRGSSAKEDPLDVVWHLTHTVTGAIELSLTKGRQGWIPRLVTIHREDHPNGTFSHTIPDVPAPDWLIMLVDKMDRLGIPIDISGNEATKLLRDAKQGSRRDRVGDAVRFRKGRASVPGKSGYTRDTPPSTPAGHTRTHPQETLTTIDENVEYTFGASPSMPMERVPPLRRGNAMAEPEEEDFEPDPDFLPDDVF